MKILVCSDSHGNNEALDQLVKKHPDMDYYLHAGDSESAEYSLTPFRTVRGNCDYFTTASEQIIISTPYGKLLMKHTPIADSNFIKKENIKIFIHGHTHIRKLAKSNEMYIINPGSISFSRDGNDLSYAILTILNDGVDVKFHSLMD